MPRFAPVLLPSALLLTLMAGPMPSLLAEDDLLDLDDSSEDDSLAGDLGFAEPKLPEGPKADHPPVGEMVTLKAVHDQEITYETYLPAAYESKPATGLPVLVIQNPGGKTKRDMNRFQAWSDKRGVILIGVNKVANGMVQHNKPRYQNGVRKDMAARKIAAHPQLWFTVGMSGGAADGQRWARRAGPQFSGCIFMGAGEVPKNRNTDHLITATLSGAKDPIYQPAKRWETVAAAKEAGKIARMQVIRDLKHEWFPQADIEAMLDWMIVLAPLTNPYLDKADATDRRAATLGEITTLGKQDSATIRTEAPRFLSAYPLQEEAAFIALSKAYRAAVNEHAAALTGLEQAQFWYTLSRSDLAKEIPTIADGWHDNATSLGEQLGAEWQAYVLWQKAYDEECIYGQDKEGLKKVAKLYLAAAAVTDGGAYAEKSQARADLIDRYVNK